MRAVLWAHYTPHYISEYIPFFFFFFFTAKWLRSISASSTQAEQARMWILTKRSNVFPKRIKHDRAAVNSLCSVTGPAPPHDGLFCITFPVQVHQSCKSCYTAEPRTTADSHRIPNVEGKECCLIELFKCSLNYLCLAVWLILTNGTFYNTSWKNLLSDSSLCFYVPWSPPGLWSTNYQSAQ